MSTFMDEVRNGDADRLHYLVVPRLELRELAHEWRGDLRVDLAVEKNGTVRLAQHWTEGAQLVQGANRVGLEPERLRDRGEIYVRKHRLSDRKLAHREEVQLGSIGAVIHQHDDQRKILADRGLQLAHGHEEAAVADDQHRGRVGPALRHAERRAEAETDGGELAGHLEMAGCGDAEIGQDAEKIASVVDDIALPGQQLVELDAQRAGIHGPRRVGDLEVARDVESRDAGQNVGAVERLVCGAPLR